MVTTMKKPTRFRDRHVVDRRAHGSSVIQIVEIDMCSTILLTKIKD